MGAVNIDMLLKPVTPESPCGDDLRYDGRYLEVLRLSEGKPEQVIGSTTKPAEDPNWRELRDGCFELLTRAKDLRITVLLCLAMVKMEGYAGLRDAFAVMRGVVDQYWETFYPRLDPDDGNDPTERVNIIAAMAVPLGSFGDPLRFLDRVREAPLCESRTVGRVTMRDIAIAMGEAVVSTAVEGQEAPKPKDLALIDAAFSECEVGPLEVSARTIEECLDHVKGIEAGFTKWVGLGKAPDLTGLRTLLADSAKQVRKRIPTPGGPTPAGAAEAVPGIPAAGAAAAPARLAGEINSWDDVRLAFGKVISYYERTEPSSPVPLIVKCAERMVGRDFLDISKTMRESVVEMLKEISTPPEQSS